MIYYLDASALVKRYISEPGSDAVTDAVREAIAIGTVVISRAEVAAALAKASRVGLLAREQSEAMIHLFFGEWPSLMRIQVSEALVERASFLAWKYGLRGYDSVQLAAAVLWQEAVAAPLAMMTFDRHLWATAQQEGLKTFPQQLP